MNKFAATLLTAMAMAALPIAVPVVFAPVSQADVCGDVGGRHVDVGGCTDVARDVAVGAAVAEPWDAAGQIAAGWPPCYTPAGVPYYTPGDAPCY
ncbi:hypothetical protein BH09ACT7_BH09ACT7_36320 [soil metagenome]